MVSASKYHINEMKATYCILIKIFMQIGHTQFVQGDIGKGTYLKPSK